jgi:hypothetical protein
MTYYEIKLLWPDDNLIQDRDDAALCLNYQEEVPNPEDESVMIPNPISKVRWIKNRLVMTLASWIEDGAAKRAESYKVDAVAEAKTHTAGIIVE